MALNIKDPETDRLARELAGETKESITVATKIALEERLRRVQAAKASGDVFAKLGAISARGRALAILDSGSADEILGYNQFGAPE
ncbi:MAG: type II toxin-antitoxin system VapB family antitoxin [Bifidobacteriaceae bacterium]|nr:type II toxin-antitoxin system VapB family antitoxin [Bifidobacteriaceae bacterium]